MYRSRFRSWKKNDNGGKKTQSKTDIYTNRSNCHVIDRMLESGKKKWMKEQTKQYNQNKSDLSKLSCTPDVNGSIYISKFTSEMKTRKRKLELTHNIKNYEDEQHKQEWENMISHIYKKSDQHVGRIVIANRIMNRPTEMFYMDPDTCSSCNTYFSFDSITNINICQYCGYTREVLFISEDNSQDVLVTKDPGTGSVSGASKQTSDYHYVRSPLYKRYLSQFSEEMGPIPIEIMRVLYKYLSTIHFQNSIRCRPTPVSNILRQHGFSKWANMSILISKVFNGEPIPVISKSLITRLVGRFEIIFEESTRQKQKLPSFEFITNIFLRIEGENELAQSFSLQKTRTVLRKIFLDLQKLIDEVKLRDTKFSWEFIYSF
jgi:DNA-directed RNA polymerase subunit RPC12/RpoP